VLGILALLAIGFLSFKYWDAFHKLLETHQTTDSATATVQHPSPPVSKPPALEELFKSDFPNLIKFSGVLTVTNLKSDRELQIPFDVYADFAGKSYFVGFLVPHSDSVHTYEYCESLAWGWKKAFDGIVHDVSFQGGESGQMTSLNDLTFSGRVIIYYDDILTLEQIVALRAVYEKKKLSVLFRGFEYVTEQARNRKK
jgi:hypothetical protein